MLNLSIKWIASSKRAELAIENDSLLNLEDRMIVKHSGYSSLSCKILQLFLWDRNSDRSLDFAHFTLLSYGFGMGAKITCLKFFFFASFVGLSGIPMSLLVWGSCTALALCSSTACA